MSSGPPSDGRFWEHLRDDTLTDLLAGLNIGGGGGEAAGGDGETASIASTFA